MASSPKVAKEKARKAHAQARQADADYRAVKARAKREQRSEARAAAKRQTRRPWIPRTLGVLAYCVLGVFPYLASALLIPAGAVVVLMALWLFGLMWTIRIARNAPTWTPLAPTVALAVWVMLVRAGSAAFGWDA